MRSLKIVPHVVVSTIEDVGAIAHFLPPYSPDYNPIDEAFSKVKYKIKSLEMTMDISDIEIITLAAFTSITQHAGLPCRDRFLT